MISPHPEARGGRPLGEATKEDLLHLFGGPKPVVWSHVTDAVLARLGAVDSVRAASAAINDEFSWCGGGRGAAEAFVIADESVIGPENNEGVVMVDELLPWYEDVAFQSSGIQRAAVDRMVCALAILSLRRQGLGAPSGKTLKRAQSVLSGVLLDHPVLLHPRLIMPARVRNTAEGGLGVKHVSVLTAIYMTGLAQLPSETHGYYPQRVRAFANTALLLAPITRLVPKHAMLNTARGRTRIIIDYPGDSIKAGSLHVGSPTSAFLASVLEIARLRQAKDKWPGHPDELVKESHLLSGLLYAIPRMLGANEVVVSKQGTSTERSAPSEQFMDELLQSGLANHAKVTKNLLRYVQKLLLRSDGAAPSMGDPAAMPTWAVEENTRQQLEILKRVGLARDQVGAATWLYENLLVAAEGLGRSIPYAKMPHALGFLTALAKSGFAVPGEPPSNLDERGRVKGLVSNYATWVAAHAVVSRTQAMETVLGAALGDVEPQPGAEVAPARRRAARL